MPIIPPRNKEASKERHDLSVAYAVRAKTAPAKRKAAPTPVSLPTPAPKAVEPVEAPVKEVTPMTPQKRPALTKISAPRIAESTAFKVRTREEIDAEERAPKAPAAPVIKEEPVVEAAVVAPKVLAPKPTPAPVAYDLPIDDEEDDVQHDSIASAILARRAKLNKPVEVEAAADESVDATDELPELDEAEDDASDMISKIRSKMLAKRMFR